MSEHLKLDDINDKEVKKTFSRVAFKMRSLSRDEDDLLDVWKRGSQKKKKKNYLEVSVHMVYWKVQ